VIYLFYPNFYLKRILLKNKENILMKEFPKWERVLNTHKKEFTYFIHILNFQYFIIKMPFWYSFNTYVLKYFKYKYLLL